MKILIVGSGGREHALAWSFKRHDDSREVFCANGNAGISEIAECVPIKPDDIGGLVEFATSSEIDLTFVGGESSLALGIVDEFETRGLKIVGPTQKAARLEASKSFAKEFMIRHRIPTAAYESVASVDGGKEAIGSGKFGDENATYVLKADGLAAGKGVVLAQGRQKALETLEAMFRGEVVSEEACNRVVIEECLTGKEVSVLAFVDGVSYKLMPPTRDHKRIGEKDTGENTGGMGTICDDSFLSKEQVSFIKDAIIRPTIEGASEEGFPIKGILFVGLMLTEGGPKVLEYNMRFGDPETQSVLVRLESDLLSISESIASGTLSETEVTFSDGVSACVIVSSENYPKTPRTGDRIKGLAEAGAMENVVVFHSGTAFDSENEIVTSGGRVLGVTAKGSTDSSALHRVYKAINKIEWEGMYFRRDIGRS
ncbi:MAG: phosphoribosylamine--glycine ligase [Pyrinomonadaceae bacterium]